MKKFKRTRIVFPYYLDIPHLFYSVLKHQHLKAFNKKRHRPAPFLKACRNASFTVEASVVLPIMIFAAVMVMMFFRILTVQWGVRTALFEIGRQSSVYGEAFGGDEKGGLGILSTGALIATAEAEIMAKKVPTEYIMLGLSGINLLSSKVDDKDINLVATYMIKMPISIFGNEYLTMRQCARVRRWNGYDPKDGMGDSDEYVYITATGSAYHSRIDCVYLNPSVSPVNSGDIGAKRNASGGKYYPCDRCISSGKNVYYITDYGTVYHTSLSCSSLKRDISKVKTEEAISSGHHACNKCGG